MLSVAYTSVCVNCQVLNIAITPAILFRRVEAGCRRRLVRMAWDGATAAVAAQAHYRPQSCPRQLGIGMVQDPTQLLES